MVAAVADIEELAIVTAASIPSVFVFLVRKWDGSGYYHRIDSDSIDVQLSMSKDGVLFQI